MFGGGHFKGGFGGTGSSGRRSYSSSGFGSGFGQGADGYSSYSDLDLIMVQALELVQKKQIPLMSKQKLRLALMKQPLVQIREFVCRVLMEKFRHLKSRFQQV